MSEWWTYRLYDFLLFTPRTYYRLFELYNAAIWPVQLLAIAIGVLLILMCARGAGRAAALVLVSVWLWVAVAFLALRYATINWAATYAAWGFGIQAALLLWLAARGRFDPPPSFARRLGLGLIGFAVFIEPLSGLVLGRPLRQIELFATTPDATVVATLGALLALRPRRRWLLMIIPVLWCLLTGLTLLAMSAKDFWIAPAAAVFSIALSFLRPTLTGAAARAAPTNQDV
jgi:multidrug transporter EmrE-like cation transporter